MDVHSAWQTWRHGVAGLAPGDMDRQFAWQAWRLWHLGTWRYGRALCVAGVALGDIDLHSAWQAWHLRHWAGSGGIGLALVARKTCRSSILSRLLLRYRHGHVIFSDTSCEHDQTDGWVAVLLCVVSLAFGVRDALRMAGRHN